MGRTKKRKGRNKTSNRSLREKDGRKHMSVARDYGGINSSGKKKDALLCA